MRVALVHDWLVTYRGGEKVLEAMAGLFPDADVYTLFHRSGELPASLERRNIRTSDLQALPGVHRYYRRLLPVLPLALRTLRLPATYDLVISSSHCVAKGIAVPEGARHLSYVYAPMRYMWHQFDQYFGPGRAGWPTRLAALAARPYLRHWDVASVRTVDRFVTLSRHIASKILELYGRPAEVVYPPVELDRFVHRPVGEGKGGYFLWLGALAPYKRVDLAIAAAARLKVPLWIAGAGQVRLKDLPPNVRALGPVSDERAVELYRDARALLFTGEEDFGLTPLEAQACGRPVIALGRGGALETVSDRTGVFFNEASTEALCQAIRKFETWEKGFDPAQARQNAQRFSPDAFRRQFLAQVDDLMGRDSNVAAKAGSARSSA
jgi:glycosyltransferase involved in cell wall biosynthesis